MDKRANVDLVEKARQLRLQVERLEADQRHLEKEVKLARGTARIKRPTNNVVVKPSAGPYYVGDDGPTDELVDAIRRMLTDRPCRFQDILEATGARDNRIKGSITRLKTEGAGVVDISPAGSGRAARWFIPDAAVLERIERVKRNAVRK